MDVVCEMCGVVGFKRLLVQCHNCKDSTRHRYCMDTIVYDEPSIEWFCDDCLPKHHEPMESLEAFSNQMEQDHIQLDPSIINGSYVDRVEVTKELRPWGRHECRSGMAKRPTNKHLPMESLEAFSNQMEQDHIQLDPSIINGSYVDRVEVTKELRPWGRHGCRSRMAKRPTSKHFLNGGTFNSSKMFNGKLSKYNDVEKEANNCLIDSTKCVDGPNHSASIPTSQIKEHINVRTAMVGLEPTMKSKEGLDLSKEKDGFFPLKQVEDLFPRGMNGDSFSSTNDVERYHRRVTDNSFSILPSAEQAHDSSHKAESVEQPHPLEVVKPDGLYDLALDPALKNKENICSENAVSSCEPTLNSILPSAEQADGSSHIVESVEQPRPLEVVKPDGSDHSASEQALETKEHIGSKHSAGCFEPTLNSIEWLDLSTKKDSCISSLNVVVGSIPHEMKTDLFSSINDVERSHPSIIGSSPTTQSEEQVDSSSSPLDSWKQPHPLEVIPPSFNMPKSIEGSKSPSTYSQRVQGSDRNIGNDPLNSCKVFLDPRSTSKAIERSCFSNGQGGSTIEKDAPDRTECVLHKEFVAPAFDNLKGSNLSVEKDCLVSSADKHLLCAKDKREQGQSEVTSHQNILRGEVICSVLNERSNSWEISENSNPKSALMENQHGSNLQDGVHKTSVHADKNVTCKKALQTEGVNSEVLPSKTVNLCKETKISSEKRQNQSKKPSRRRTGNLKYKIRKKQKSIEADDAENALLGDPNGGCAQNDTAELASQDIVARDHCSVSRMPVISAPIDKPYWTGIMKIGQEYISLAAHLSNTTCKKVQEFSRSLPPVMKVTKHPKLKAWPSRWEESEPTAEDVALYFFPDNMRPNKDLDQLVHDVTVQSIVLKYAVGFAKLLIFPSVFLPEKFQLFQGKHYLWGVFKRRKVRSKRDVPVKKQDCISQVTKKRKDQQDKVQIETLDQGKPVPPAKKRDCTSPIAKKRKCQQDKVQVDKLDQQKPLPSVKKQDCTSQVAKKRKDQQDKVQGNTLDQEKPVPSVKKQDCTSQVVKKRKDQQDKVQVDTLNHEKPVSKHNISNDNQPLPDTVNGVNAETIQPGDDGKVQPSSEAPAPMCFGLIDVQTPRSHQLIRELQNEGASILAVN